MNDNINDDYMLVTKKERVNDSIKNIAKQLLAMSVYALLTFGETYGAIHFGKNIIDYFKQGNILSLQTISTLWLNLIPLDVFVNLILRNIGRSVATIPDLAFAFEDLKSDYGAMINAKRHSQNAKR